MINVFGCLCLDCLSEVDVLKHTVSQLEQAIVDKERDIQRKVQAVREEEWQKLHKLDSEKSLVLFLIRVFLLCSCFLENQLV